MDREATGSIMASYIILHSWTESPKVDVKFRMLLSYVASSGGEFVGKQGRQW